MPGAGVPQEVFDGVEARVAPLDVDRVFEVARRPQVVAEGAGQFGVVLGPRQAGLRVRVAPHLGPQAAFPDQPYDQLVGEAGDAGHRVVPQPAKVLDGLRRLHDAV